MTDASTSKSAGRHITACATEDCCCGSGRMLLAVANENRERLLRVFIGHDVDLRCVKMTTLNLALHNLTGYVIWGNTLAAESKKVYETGFNGRTVIREIAPADCPARNATAVVRYGCLDTSESGDQLPFPRAVFLCTLNARHNVLYEGDLPPSSKDSHGCPTTPLFPPAVNSPSLSNSSYRR